MVTSGTYIELFHSLVKKLLVFVGKVNAAFPCEVEGASREFAVPSIIRARDVFGDGVIVSQAAGTALPGVGLMQYYA